MMAVLAAGLKLLLFAIITLPLMPLQAVLVTFAPRLAGLVPHLYHRALCRICGFDVTQVGRLPDAGPCLIVSNHVSWIDIIALSSLAPMSFVAKREVGTWPVFGWLAKLQRTVFIDRERRHSTAQSRDELAERTSHHGASVLPFKSSFFAAAREGVAVVPVTLAYRRHWGLPLNRRNRPRFAWYANIDLMPHLWSALQDTPVTVEVIIGEALPPGLDRKQAAQRAEAVIRENLAAALHGRLKLR
jgi:lyso-ornithine lipid O-acyltransferase